jgi:hypothetical protein
MVLRNRTCPGNVLRVEAYRRPFNRIAGVIDYPSVD